MFAKVNGEVKSGENSSLAFPGAGAGGLRRRRVSAVRAQIWIRDARRRRGAAVYMRGARRDRCGRGARRAARPQSASGPRPRGRQLVVRSAGVCPRASGGGAEPRAGRAAARGRSVSPRRVPRARARRTRSLLAPPAPRPRLRPVFLWTRRAGDGHVQAVHCEDYDSRNRLRVARTARGWTAIPRTAVYDAIAVPPRRSEPTPLDSLLAVAERELREQRASPAPAADAHVALFESLSDAHCLAAPEDPHDALLASLVARGCEDLQVVPPAPDDTLPPDAAALLARLERELAAEPRRSMTAAQGLLHLQQLPAPQSFLPADHDQDMLCDMPADILCALPTDLPEDLPCDLPGEIPCELPDEIPCELPCELPVEMTSELAVDVPSELPVEVPGQLSCEVDSESSVDARPREVLEQMPVERPDQAPSEVPENEVPSEIPCESINGTPNDMLGQMHEVLPDEPPKQSTYESNGLTDLAKSMTDMYAVRAETEFKESMLEGGESGDPVEELAPKLEIDPDLSDLDYLKDLADSPGGVELVPTDLRVKPAEKQRMPHLLRTTNAIDDNFLEKSDEQPKDLSVHKRGGTPPVAWRVCTPLRSASPHRPESRESDARQSPQPSGIPALPASPDPAPKNKQALFLESLLSSPSPKMYTSEVTITKQQCEPLNLGKHRKSASPTVTSCSDEIKQMNKDFGEPQEKKVKRESSDKQFDRRGEEYEDKPKKLDPSPTKPASPLKQLQMLKTSRDFNIPDPLLVPKNKLNQIISAPAKEIPALLIQRPELRLPEVFSFPGVLQDPDILVISLSQLESILENDAKKQEAEKNMENKSSKQSTPTEAKEKEKSSKIQSEPAAQPKPIPSMDALAGDIDAATSAALSQMLWLPYLSQLEAMAACSQNMDFLKALNSTGYPPPSYAELSQLFPAHRLPPPGFPPLPECDPRLQLAAWQEAMAHRARASSIDQHMKEMASKSTDVQNPYVHSTKSHSNKSHSAARTSPIAPSYSSSQRANHGMYLPGMYPGVGPGMRPNMPLPGLQIPYFNPSMMGSQRSPRTPQQKSPLSPYFPNNNYLQSLKQSEVAVAAGAVARSSSVGSQESPRPRISVKSLHNLLEPAGTTGARRTPQPSSGPPTAGRRRDEPEVGSTTPADAPLLPPHHDPASFHLWHPLFGNHKSYNSPWSWTTVTATGD